MFDHEIMHLMLMRNIVDQVTDLFVGRLSKVVISGTDRAEILGTASANDFVDFLLE